MPEPERSRFDFALGAWVLPDPTMPVERPWAPPEVRGEPAPGRWTKPPQADGPTLDPQGVAAAAGLALAVVGVGTATFAAGFVAAVLVLAVAAVVEGVRQLGRLGPTDADRRLIENPDDRDVCLVALTVVRDGETLGHDRGAAWFADGALLYSGHRTSFVIGGEDVLPQASWYRFQNAEGYSFLPDAAIPLRIPFGSAYARLEPLEGREGAGPARRARFLKRLYEFCARPPQSRVERQWPPGV